MLGAFILWRKRRSVAGITVAEAEIGLSPEERKKLDSILKDNG